MIWIIIFFSLLATVLVLAACRMKAISEGRLTHATTDTNLGERGTDETSHHSLHVVLPR
jgi:hypothetical protein